MSKYIIKNLKKNNKLLEFNFLENFSYFLWREKLYQKLSCFGNRYSAICLSSRSFSDEIKEKDMVEPVMVEIVIVKNI